MAKKTTDDFRETLAAPSLTNSPAQPLGLMEIVLYVIAGILAAAIIATVAATLVL